MTRKRAAVAVAVLAAAALLLLLVVRGGDSGGSDAGENEDAAGGSAAAAAGPRAPRVDPRTQPRGHVAGRVISAEGGAPVAGAFVCTTFWSEDLAGEDTREPKCTTSDERGAFRFDDLFAARYAFTASAPRFLSGHYEDPDDDDTPYLELEPGAAHDGLVIELAPGGVEVHGVVSDVGGGPVGGAFVTVDSGGWRGGHRAMVTSRDDGTFTAWVAEGRVRATAIAEGYASGTERGIAPGQFLEILLTPESVLAGVVVEVGTDTPVAGARVTVTESWGGFGQWRRGGGGGASAMTDESGRFRVTRLEPGRYKPHATTTGRWGEATESVLLGLGQTVEDVRIEVHPAWVVTGTVLTDGDEPCEDGMVRLHDPARDRTARSQTDDAGRVRMEAVLPGTYEVTVGCEDFLSDGDHDDVEVAGAAPIWCGACAAARRSPDAWSRTAASHAVRGGSAASAPAATRAATAAAPGARSRTTAASS